MNIQDPKNRCPMNHDSTPSERDLISGNAQIICIASSNPRTSGLQRFDPAQIGERGLQNPART